MKWIDIQDPTPSSSGKTNIWGVTSKQGGTFLGRIYWFGRWRKYVFAPDTLTVFEEDCLRDIADFCEQATKELRKSWAERKDS